MKPKTLLIVALLLGTGHVKADTPPNSITIPLKIEKLSDGAYKLGICVSLGGGPFKLYEFDTGGTGFYAANNSAWWSNYTTVNPVEVTQTYASGISYNATIVNTTIDLGHGLPVITANMGQIQNAEGNDVPDWNTKVADGIPPLWDHFFGDFGADLSEKNGIFGFLPQLPGNLANGFIVRTGGFANPDPTLQIGITDDDRARFPFSAAMQGASNTTLFPNSKLNTFAGPLIAGNATFKSAAQTVSFPIGFIVDSGAPSMLIFDNGSNVTLPADFLQGNQVISGLSANFSSGNLNMNFNTNTISGLNLVSDTPSAAGDINTGLIPFFQYDIMFDIEDHEVRFAPASVPEHATTSLFAGFIVGAAVLFSSRRRSY